MAKTITTFTEHARAVQEAWPCTRKMAILATRYYRGIDTADDLIGPRYISSDRPHPSLLSARELKAIIEAR